MTRQHKFRVWDKLTKQMVGGFLGSNGLLYGSHIDIHLGTPIDDMPVMMCTGVQDKNSKDIYDGDILKLDDDGTDYITHVRSHEGVLVVNYEGDDYNLISPNFLPDWCELEVIGNIYQNKELMDKK